MALVEGGGARVMSLTDLLRASGTVQRTVQQALQQTVQQAVLWVRPDGGQQRSRRNAWASMVQDTRRRAERAEVARALAVAAPDGGGPAGEIDARRCAQGGR